MQTDVLWLAVRILLSELENVLIGAQLNRLLRL